MFKKILNGLIMLSLAFSVLTPAFTASAHGQDLVIYPKGSITVTVSGTNWVYKTTGNDYLNFAKIYACGNDTYWPDKFFFTWNGYPRSKSIYEPFNIGKVVYFYRDGRYWKEGVALGSCPTGYETKIPHYDLFLTHVKGGFGTSGPNSAGQQETTYFCTLLSSTDGPVTLPLLASKCLVGDLKGKDISALPPDLTNPTCSAPVLAKTNESAGMDVQGIWACDSLLTDIATELPGVTVNGTRFPLYSSTNPNQSLWDVYTEAPWSPSK